MVTSAEDIFDDIVVGVGGSESSYSALRYAFDFADSVQGRVTAVIVEETIPPSVLAVSSGAAFAGFIDRAQDAASLLAEQTEDMVRKIALTIDSDFEVRLEQGRVAECLARASESATLVCLGKHGHGESHGGLLGSNAEQAVRRIRSPVFISPPEHGRVDEIIVAYAAKEPGRMNLRVGRWLQRTFKRPLVVFTAQKSDGACKQMLEAARNDLGDDLNDIRFESDLSNAASAIVHRTSNRSLLVMGAYGRSRLYHMVLGSVTEEVIRAARGPVMLTRKLLSE